MKRLTFGVIAAQVSDIEQREILKSAIETAQGMDIDIAVISNIYNPNEPSDVLKNENNIYDLILSDEFDGFILISEAIINTQLKERIISHLSRKTDIPVIAIGTPQPDFILPHFHYINSSDEADIEDITDHLIEVHHFTDIHILTGHDFIEASYNRINGYKKSLEKHGISFHEDKVFFGDFWLNSGRTQAKKYISGELKKPQALICCNDYMAYGVLDTFMEHNVDIPEEMTLVGYEYVHERRNHTPLLTTYQRNRRQLGDQAVRLLADRLKTSEYGEFTPMKGRLITGDTCQCGAKREDIKREIKELQTKATYDFLNFFSQLEHRLTECRNINEFTHCCREFRYLVRNADRMYLCLYENWYDKDLNSDNMIRYDLFANEQPVLFLKNQFTCLFRDEAAPYYFCPIFFSDRELGFVVVRFNGPDTYDHIFRNLLKSISNGLEFLRMKNDIQYLIECQNVAEQRDTMTGLLNENGLRSLFGAADKTDMCIVGMKVFLFEREFSPAYQKEKVAALKAATECIQEFCSKNDLRARLKNDTFVCLMQRKTPPELLAERLCAFLCQHTGYMKQYGMDSFVCSAFRCSDESYSKNMDILQKLLSEQIHIISERRLIKQYMYLNELRTYIYLNPEDTFDVDKIHEQYDVSPGYLRSIYKECFKISFHQDCISARIAKAQYLLMTTSFSSADIAELCGYSDNKYFMRQFAMKTGMTANKYRAI